MSTESNGGVSTEHRRLSYTPGVQDPYGQASLLLVESLIHGLKERGVLSVAEAVDIIESAADVQYDLADAANGAGSDLRHAASLLTAMAVSLRNDVSSNRYR